MPRGQGAVEVVRANRVVFPAHRVVQRVHACVAPVAVEVELGQGGAAAGEFEQFLAGLQGNLGGQYLGLGHRNRRAGGRLGIHRAGVDLVQHLPGPAQQRLGGMQFKLQAADVCNDIEVVAGAVYLGFDPRARLCAHESNGVIDGGLGNACVNGRLDELRGGALGIGYLPLAPVVDDQICFYRNVIEQYRAAGRGALTETRPIVDDA